jgi:hypothetical protein
MTVERQTYQESRMGLDLLYNELQKKYEDECQSKQVGIKKIFAMKRFLFSSSRMLKQNINYKLHKKMILLKQLN